MSIASPPKFLSASVGQKVLMALSGFVFVMFVIVHLIGNLQIFIGQEQLNKYAETLQNMGALKYAFRAFLLIFLGLHMWKGVVLWWQNRQARPVAYAKDDTLEATIASRTMIYTGAMIIAFVVYHLMHFTLITTNPEYANIPLADGRFDVYTMVITGFQNIWISGAYIISMILLFFHLSHAISSMFQTMGWADENCLPRIKKIATALAFVIFLGYLSMPVAVLTNFIKLPGGGY